MANIPIAYVTFNRTRHARETFAAIRAQQSARLFIVADGPRQGHPTAYTSLIIHAIKS